VTCNPNPRREKKETDSRRAVEALIKRNLGFFYIEHMRRRAERRPAFGPDSITNVEVSPGGGIHKGGGDDAALTGRPARRE